MPRPGGRNDFLNVLISCFPTQQLSSKRRIRNQFCRVAFTTLADDRGYLAARHFATGLNNFSNAMPSPRSQVQFEFSSGRQFPQGEQVSGA